MNMPILTQFNQNQKTMSTREISGLTGSEHPNVLKTVRALILKGIVSGNETLYRHEQNNQLYPEIHLDFRNTMVVVSGYSAELRAKIIDRWQELESQSPVNLPDYPTALRLYADQLEITARIEQERDHAIATKAEIGSRREATAMGRLSAKVKEVESLKVQLDKSLDFASIKSVEIATGRKFGWHSLKKWSKSNNSEIKTIPDPNFGEVKTYHKDAWLAVYNINLSSIGGAA